MKGISKYYPAAIGTIVLLALVASLYPYCRYYIDPDATAYFTIAKRYAAGDYARAVNGYWSPFSCWLVAIDINAGLNEFLAAVIVNTAAAIGFIWVSQALFNRFHIKSYLQWALNLSLAVFLSYAVYKQLFADLWECFFLLLSLRILLSKHYTEKKWLWIVNGIAGALAYFAKAYAFPFFIVHIMGCGLTLYMAWERKNVRKWLQSCVVTIVVMLVCCTPWIYTLHQHYGIWMTSTAGRLNTSWYLVGHPYFNDSIIHLLPPSYSNSPYYWEDPYLVNGATPHFWTSGKLFALQIVKVGYNLLKFVISGNELSAFYLFTWLLGLTMLISKKTRYMWGDKSLLLGFSFILFPLGFIIINYEARYIWYTIPLSMIVGALVLQKVLLHVDRQKTLGPIAILLFAFSYMVYPLWDMRSMINEGKAEYGMAERLKENNIQGSFASNLNHAPEVRSTIRLAYYAGCPYYNMPFEATTGQVLAEMRRYGIKYYFYWPAYSGDAFVMQDEQGRPMPYWQAKEGLKVFFINR